MTTRGKNIQLFLMDGEAGGRIKCTLANRTGVAYKIPRTELDKCKERDDLKQSGVYFLFGTSDETGKGVVYIGQAGARKNGEGILNRLQEHKRNPEKDYWTEAIVFTTSNNSFGPTEISYLENRFCNLALEANRYEVKNGNDPTPGNITEEEESELEIPHGFVLGLCGMSGCGKTTILRKILPKCYEDYLYVSQKPLKGQSFTTVATYTKLLDEIRTCYAKALGKDKGYFSQRGKGACDKCGGTGVIEIGSFYEEKLFDTCDKCNGTGYLQEVLEWKVDGVNIYDIQQMTIDELIASGMNISAKADKMLKLLSDLGIGYLKLSQKVKTLSGGENQRIKLAEALNDNKYSMIGLDEPAKGLGKRETARLLGLIYSQVSKNKKTFIIAEYDTMFLNYCSYFAELRRKGQSTTIVFQGSREQLFKDKKNDIRNWLTANPEELK